MKCSGVVACLLSFVGVFVTMVECDATALSEPNSTIVEERNRRLAVFRKVLVSDYLKFHRAHRRDHPRLVFRLSTFHPGLGDRFGGFFHAYVSAVLTNRVFLIDWKFPFQLSRLFDSNSDAEMFYDEKDEKDEERKSTLHCYFDCQVGDLDMFGANYTVIQNRSLILRSYDIVRMAGKYKHYTRGGMLIDQLGIDKIDDERMPSDAEIYHEIFKSILQISPKFQAFIKANADGIIGHKYVGIHARVGEGVLETGPRFAERREWHRLSTCMGNLALDMMKSHQGDGTVYLATDTRHFRVVFEKEMNKLGLKVLMGKWEPKHLARMRHVDDQDFDQFQIAVMEMLLLGKGVALVATDSRYSIAGANIGGLSHVKTVGIRGSCRGRVQVCCT